MEFGYGLYILPDPLSKDSHVQNYSIDTFIIFNYS
ncbi:uncharacterized protein METZ01_LOCUS52222 [marine metagenome]|uniref:Uncharacterized protein n=1 Tax=marine metagenome TaxID=408172 RepID=A0A381S7U0_9ZZZZ